MDETNLVHLWLDQVLLSKKTKNEESVSSARMVCSSWRNYIDKELRNWPNHPNGFCRQLGTLLLFQEFFYQHFFDTHSPTPTKGEFLSQKNKDVQKNKKETKKETKNKVKGKGKEKGKEKEKMK